MAGDDDSPGSISGSPDDQPIDAIAGLNYEPRPDFVPRLRNRIQRRMFGNEVVDFSWSAIPIVLLAFVSVIFSVLGDTDRDPEN